MKVNTGSSVNVNKGQTSERTNNAPNQVSDQKKNAVQKPILDIRNTRNALKPTSIYD